MTSFDDWEHPDLIEMSHLLQERLDAVLDAEQAAAASLARRSTSMLDRMLEAEDLEAEVTVGTIDGHTQQGRMLVAAFDHIEILGGAGITVVPIDAIAWVAIL